MVTITFPDRATEKRALAYLLGRFSGRVLRSGEHLVPAAALEALAEQNIPFTVKGMLDWIGQPKERYFAEGDIVVVNDAYVGGTHNNDVRLVMPVFVGERIVAQVLHAHRAERP